MIDLSILALFALACLALTATPGPDMLLIASRSASQGKASGFATLAGIQLGTYCHALAAAFGLSQLFLIVPLAYDVVRYVGAAILRDDEAIALADVEPFDIAGELDAGLMRQPIGPVEPHHAIERLDRPYWWTPALTVLVGHVPLTPARMA
jgi:hypothetical protein